jgi:nucleoside-diphosphate-sugar epimerase
MFDDLNVELIEGDITDPKSVDRATEGVSRVFNIAALYRTAGIADKVYWDVHVGGTENLLRSSFKHGVGRFIHCSTVGVHGHIEQPPADETYPFNPGDIYQRTKLEGELKAVQFSNEFGLPVTVIRPCAIYGPGDMRLYKLFKLASKKVIIIPGDGSVFYHMVYIDDLVDAFILASEVDEAIGKAFIIGGSESLLSLNEIIDLIADELAVEPTKIYLPAKPFQLLGTLVERICIPLQIEPPIHRRRVDFFTKSRAFDITKAKRILNFEPRVQIKEGLAYTAGWYRKCSLL